MPSDHDDAVPDLESVDTQLFQDSDWQHLRRMRDLVSTGADAALVAEALADIGRGGRNGLVVAIESDVSGVFGLEPSSRCRYVPKDRFARLDQARLRELVIARIDALRPGVCDVPESVYRADVHTIELDGERFPVREIAKKDWDYSLYVTTSGPQTHFAEIDHGSHAIYSVVKRITAEDSRLLSGGELTSAGIDRLVDRYR